MAGNLIIDWGNTRVKAGVFENGKLIRQLTQPTLSDEELAAFARELPLMHVLLCSVSRKSASAEQFLKNKSAVFLNLDHQTPIPIGLEYETPETLGYDRLANAVGARKLSPKDHHALSVDVGTCLKFDFVHALQGYQGGAISPGLQMRYRALNTDTHALPLVNSEAQTDLVGRSTRTSIQSGVINGMVAEIDGVIERYQSAFSPLAVFLTGGDAAVFEKALKNDIFAHSFLTLVGLNDILDFNQIT